MATLPYLERGSLRGNLMISRRLILIVVVSVFTLTTAVQAETPRRAFVDALMIKESTTGNDWAIGDKHLADWAYGCLQIRQPLCTDINRRYGTNYRAQDCLGNRELSLKLHRLYMEMYATEKRLGREPTDEDKARIWNGGPNGWKSASTNKYWADFKNILEGKQPIKSAKKTTKKSKKK